MFFNQSLKKENQQLKEQIYSHEQVRESLDQDMLRLTIDPQGKIVSANENFEKELGLKSEAITGTHLTALVPEKARQSKHFQRMKSALEQKNTGMVPYKFLKQTDKKLGCVLFFSRFLMLKTNCSDLRFMQPNLPELSLNHVNKKIC